MENKYITVSYRLYAMNGGEKELIEEAPANHPFQFISGVGYRPLRKRNHRLG